MGVKKEMQKAIANQVREEILFLRRANPSFTLAELGKRVHRTRERVRQILKAAKLPTASMPRRRGDRGALSITATCSTCGNQFTRSAREIRRRLRMSKSGSLFCCHYCANAANNLRRRIESPASRVLRMPPKSYKIIRIDRLECSVSMLRKRAQELGNYSIFQFPPDKHLLIIRGFKNRRRRFLIFRRLLRDQQAILQASDHEEIEAQAIRFPKRRSSNPDY